MQTLKYISMLLLSSALLLPSVVEAHDPWTVQECLQYSKMVQGAAEARDLGKDAAWALQAAVDYTALRIQSKKPFFVKDDADLTMLLSSVRVVFDKVGTPQEMHDKSYEACISVMVGTKDEPNPKIKYN